MNKSIKYKEVEKILFSLGTLSVFGGGLLKIFFHLPIGGILFYLGIAVCMIVSAIDYPKKTELLNLNQESIFGKIIKIAFPTGAILVIIGAIFKILHISADKWLIYIGLIPMLIYIVWFTIKIWNSSNIRNRKLNIKNNEA